jgi:hypothetical protein
MGSIKRRLGLLWATFLLSLGPFVGLLYNDPGAFGGQLQKYFILWAIMVVGYSLYLLFSFQPSGTLSPASKFVEAIASSADEYCLILRPFGADGFVPLRVALPQGSMRETLLKPVALSKTLEAVVEAEARTALGCQSVALVDPKLKIVPLSPTYIAADDDAWQGIVDKLLRRALIAVVILPPGQRARGALRWEVGRAIEVGLLGRLVFVLPPPQVEGYAAARATLDDLQSVLPGLERAPGNSIVVYPHDSSNFEWFFLNGIAGDVTYIEAFRRVLARVKTTFTGTSFLRRYPHAQQNRLSVMPKSN